MLLVLACQVSFRSCFARLAKNLSCAPGLQACVERIFLYVSCSIPDDDVQVSPDENLSKTQSENADC